MVLNNKYNATVLGNFAFVTTLLVFCVCDLLLDAKLSSKKSFDHLYCGNYTMWQFLRTASHHLMLSRAYLHFVSLFSQLFRSIMCLLLQSNCQFFPQASLNITLCKIHYVGEILSVSGIPEVQKVNISVDKDKGRYKCHINTLTSRFKAKQYSKTGAF